MCSWQTFVPFQAKWGSAVWIEIDRERVAPQFISSPDLLAKWKADEAQRAAIMPIIEAAHLGPLPLVAFKRTFLVREGDSAIETVPVRAQKVARTLRTWLHFETQVTLESL